MMQRMICLLAVLTLAWVAGPVFGADPDWSGVWVTDEGAMTLTQDGTTVTGTYGRGAQLDAEIDGRALAGTYRIGNRTGRVEFTLEEGDLAFVGEWKHPDGRTGPWRGWRQDPSAEEADVADFSGYWLTSLGTFRLSQDGSAVEGPWRHADWDRVEGEVTGRRLQASLVRPSWQGKAWIEITADGKRIYGLTNERPAGTIVGVKVEGFESNPKLVAGEVAQGIAGNGMLYFVRPPDKWRKGKPVDTIVLLHGSNWTTKGMVWVTAKNWPDLGRDYMIVGIQGNQWSARSNADDLRHNYHYPNWMGRSTYKGYPYTERDSPYLVSQIVTELSEQHKWKRVFLGGHSQGGFMAYLMHMHYPEQFAGVFPIAGGLVIQAEPNVFDDEELRKAQRATPLAVVHGQRDNVVPYDPTGLYIRDRFQSSDFPLMTFIDPDVGHPYDFLPIGDVVHWLDVMSTSDKKKLVAFGKQAAADARWRDFAAALLRARELKCDRQLTAEVKSFDTAAAVDAPRYLELLEKAEPGEWADEFVVWKRQFADAPAAAATMAAYEKLRAEHDPKAQALIDEARKAFREGNRDLGRAKYEEILSTWFVAGKYPIVRRWVEGM